MQLFFILYFFIQKEYNIFIIWIITTNVFWVLINKPIKKKKLIKMASHHDSHFWFTNPFIKNYSNSSKLVKINT
jgi:hypothetical protein